MEYLIVALCAITAVAACLAAAFANKASKAASSQKQQLDTLHHLVETQDKLNKERLESVQVSMEKTVDQVDVLRRDTSEQLDKFRQTTENNLGEIRSITGEKLTASLSRQSGELRDHLAKFDARFAGFQEQIQGFQNQMENKLGEIRKSVEKQLDDIRQDNEKQLDRMRETVDEKLTKTLESRLSTSFKQVSNQLESVHKGLGEMQNLATGVGDLKRVLSNVKSRGILGEVQLGAILSDMLTSEQYKENVVTKPGSSERVEFAVKIPQENGEYILLPIDAKFPGDTYEHLRKAVEQGDAQAVDACRKDLLNRIKQEAKDIQSKYISVPETTNFAILFLPFEGLYAEVVDQPGFLGALQRDFHITVAGPSTMSAILGTLQMTYQRLAIQQKADEIQKVLSAVKAEFPKYQNALKKALQQIDTARGTVDSIITTRTNVIQRKLKNVTEMSDGTQAKNLLGIGEACGEFADESTESEFADVSTDGEDAQDAIDVEYEDAQDLD